MRAKLCFVIGLLLIASFVSAQSSGDETSIEEAYAFNTVEGKMLFRLAISADRAMKEKAIFNIGKNLRNGGSMTIEYAKILGYLALEGTFLQVRTGGYGRPINDYPDIRIQACQLLGYAANADDATKRYAHETLLQVVYSNDFEPSVMAAAVYALANVNAPDGRADVIRAIHSVVTRFGVLNPTDSLAYDCIRALEILFNNSDDGLNDPLAMDALMLIVENGAYSQQVRDAAMKLVDKINGSQGQKSTDK